MPSEVIDTNVLTIASGALEQWVRPRIPLGTTELHLIKKVLDWVVFFRADDSRCLVMDFPERTILREYCSSRNMPGAHLYGRQVVQHKFDVGAFVPVRLTYSTNGDELVADLPPEAGALLHDLGDRKMVAAAFEAGAPIVNACDSDWASPDEQAALALLGVVLVQILTDEERTHCRGRDAP